LTLVGTGSGALPSSENFLPKTIFFSPLYRQVKQQRPTVCGIRASLQGREYLVSQQQSILTDVQPIKVSISLHPKVIEIHNSPLGAFGRH
jgi:hypothetical protein